jgi:hypothetical protein
MPKMLAPPQNRNRDHLAQEFRNLLEPYLADANEWLEAKFGEGKARMLVYETARTLLRQKWMWKHGRERGYGVWGRFITWTLLSAHRLSRAADVVPQVLVNGRWVARWDLMDDLLRAVPLAKYGLEGIPQELVHIQMRGMLAEGMENYVKRRKLVWDKPERSRWPK